MKRPRYDLAQAQKGTLQVPKGCARKAAVFFNLDLDLATKHIGKLFKSLTAADFAYVATMRGDDGKPFYGDVYGKRDKHCVWFIKIRHVNGTTTIILSCHAAEADLPLADGRTLRKSP